MVLTSCRVNRPEGIAAFVYLSGDRSVGHSFVEYYPAEEQKQYVNTNVGGDHYLNSYYDGTKLYLSLGHAFYVYDSLTKNVTELVGYTTDAIKKINGDVWVALENGFTEEGFMSSLCKISDDLQFDCLYKAKNQQLTDFYFDFENQVFYGAGLGVHPVRGGGEYKVVKYDMQSGEEIDIRNEGEQIMTSRLTNICLGHFITSDGNIYRETGEKVGEVIGTKGKRLNSPVNDIVKNTTAFVDYDNKLIEVYGCKNDEISHIRTIGLSYEPNLYPVSHSWETTDNGEISMPIDLEGDIFEYIGFQSINLRTGEVQVHLFDERVHMLHAVARFV